MNGREIPTDMKREVSQTEYQFRGVERLKEEDETQQSPLTSMPLDRGLNITNRQRIKLIFTNQSLIICNCSCLSLSFLALVGRVRIHRIGTLAGD